MNFVRIHLQTGPAHPLLFYDGERIRQARHLDDFPRLQRLLYQEQSCSADHSRHQRCVGQRLCLDHTEALVRTTIRSAEHQQGMHACKSCKRCICYAPPQGWLAGGPLDRCPPPSEPYQTPHSGWTQSERRLHTSDNCEYQMTSAPAKAHQRFGDESHVHNNRLTHLPPARPDQQGLLSRSIRVCTCSRRSIGCWEADPCRASR